MTMIAPDPDVETLNGLIDSFLEVIATIRALNPRDPLRALEDALLDMRQG